MEGGTSGFGAISSIESLRVDFGNVRNEHGLDTARLLHNIRQSTKKLVIR